MPEIILKIPQIGEGLQEARVVSLLKQPGEWVNRDEPIYQMETDKAVMDVESPHSGRVIRWLAAADDVLTIGADILALESDSEAPVQTSDAAAPLDTPAAAGPAQELCIPHIGEGLQEARIVALLKQPGDLIKRDEIIYQIETDKAVMDIESPIEGVLIEWTVQVDEVAPIGGVVGRVSGERQGSASHATPPSGPQGAASAPPVKASSLEGDSVRRTDLPPRTRAYAKSKGLTDFDLASIPPTGRNLMESDVDAYMGGSAKTAAISSSDGFTDKPLSGKQKILASRLQRGSQLVVPGMMSIVVDWSEIEALKDEQKAAGGDFQPSTFTYFAFAVAKAAADHPVMRSSMMGDSTIRTYDHLQLGIAVALPGDDLVVAVVKDSDSLSWRQFADEARSAIGLARQGKDQANERVTISITNMAGHGIREAMAVVVPPGVATIFLGEPYWGLSNKDARVPGFMRCANVGITIDHRLINGVGGAEFLNSIRKNVEGIRKLVV